MENELTISNNILQSSTSKFPIIQISSPQNLLQKRNSIRIPLFIRAKSISKPIQFLKKHSRASINSSVKATKKKSQANLNFDNNSIEELSVKEIYRNDDDNFIPKLIQKFTQIKECSILKYGLKPSTENIEFSFCRTCDPNLINPICKECIKKCHSGHKIKNNNMNGKIKCICGERLHCMSKKPDLTINNSSCELGEWYIVSKLNFYYKTNDNECLCMLCYNFCNYNKKKDKIIQLNSNNDNKKNIPKCCCENEEVHQERKVFFEKMEKIARRLDTFEYFNLLHPSQIINMIFLSKNQFSFNYADLIFLNDILINEKLSNGEILFFKKAKFASTNYYLIFRHLIEFIKWNKNSNITYYCKEAENYFSFKKVKFVLSLMDIMKYNEKSFWLFSSKFLLLFHKIYIGNKTQLFPKFKINDLENFSSSLRILLRNSNKRYFLEGNIVIHFFISLLTKININGFSSIEALDTINVTIIILKKMAGFNLLSNSDMVRTIYELEKILFHIKSFRKIIVKTHQNKSLGDIINYNINENILNKINHEIIFEKEITLYYNIIKLVNIFILSFNDRLINKILSNNKEYPNIDSINKENISFSFVKTD